MKLETLTIEFVRDMVARRQVNAVALVEQFYAEIEKRDAEIHAYLHLYRDRALAKAEEIERLADKGTELPPLAGVPIAIKDVVMTGELLATAGSRILQKFVAPYDATAFARLDAAGAILLGKLNCDEFAMGSSNENSAFGPVRNPHDHTRVPGGSSGGSAAAVAAGTAVATLGSDTGGSIRQPAAFCGVVGLKPTYGRVSRYGLIAFASSLDHLGPITRTVKDAAIMLRTIAGHDPLDTTSADVPVPDYEAEIGKPVKGLRVGIPGEYFGEGLNSEVRGGVESAIDNLRTAGCEIVKLSLPHTKYAIPTYYIIATAEASSNLARFDSAHYGLRAEAKSLDEMYRNSRDAGFGDEVKRRILLGTCALSAGYHDAYYMKAQKVRALIARDFRDAFQRVDAILAPTTPTPAFKLGEKLGDPLAMYLADVFTVTANLAGIPAISVPCGTTRDGLPVGAQLLGRHFDEATILRLAHVIEHEQAKPAVQPGQSFRVA